MNRFLHFILAAYAPLAARHALIDGQRARTKADAQTNPERANVAHGCRIDIARVPDTVWLSSHTGNEQASLAA